jgi:hypothetical protein
MPIANLTMCLDLLGSNGIVLTTEQKVSTSCATGSGEFAVLQRKFSSLSC